MKCLIISPKNGVVRISRYVATNIVPSDVAVDSVDPKFGSDGSEFSELDRRCTAPLRLSKALQAQLPAQTYRRN